MTSSELTTDIDLILTARFIVERCVEIRGRAEREELLGRALAVLHILDDRLQRRREDTFTEECRVEAEAEERKLRRMQKRMADLTTPPVEVAPPQPFKLSLVPANPPLQA